MSTAGRAVVQHFYDMALSGNIAGMLEVVDDDVTLVEADGMPYGGTVTGHAGLLKVFTAVYSVWKDCQFELERLIADGDWVVAISQMSGAGATSGIAFKMPLAEVFRVRNGKIVEILPFYFDTKRLHDIHNG